MKRCLWLGFLLLHQCGPPEGVALKKALFEAHRVLDNGYLCAANFYFKKEPPQELILKAEDMLGFKIDVDFDDKMKSLSKGQFELETFEDHLHLIHPQEILKGWVKNFIDKKFSDSSLEFKKEAYEKLFHYRHTLNELRRYQGYRKEVWLAL